VTPRARSSVGWLLVVSLALVYLVTGLRVDADFSAFLPSGVTDTQRVFLKQMQEGVAGRLLLVEVRGDEPQRLAAISQALADRLMADSTFRYVNNGGTDFGQRELALIERYRYRLSDGVTAGRFTAAGCAALEERRRGRRRRRSLESDCWPMINRRNVVVLQRLTPAKPRRARNGSTPPATVRC
jgi:predicted exporter